MAGVRRKSPSSVLPHVLSTSTQCVHTSPAGLTLTFGALTIGCFCDIMRHITNRCRLGRSIMSVRKRAWITSKGEEREAWIVDYSDQTGARHLKTFERKKEADAYHATVRVDIRAGVHTSSKATVAGAGKHWIESCKGHGLEASTVESYQQHLDDHIVPYLGAVRLSQ